MILQLISENAPSYVIGVDAEERRTNRETMVADCYVQFVKDLPKYDPDKSSPLTYFRDRLHMLFLNSKIVTGYET